MAELIPPMPSIDDDPFGYADWIKKFDPDQMTAMEKGGYQPGSTKSSASSVAPNIGSSIASYEDRPEGTNIYGAASAGGLYGSTGFTGNEKSYATDYSEAPATPGMVYGQGRSQDPDSPYYLPSAIAPSVKTPPAPADTAVAGDASQWNLAFSQYLSQLDAKGELMTAEKFQKDYAAITGFFDTPLEDISFKTVTSDGNVVPWTAWRGQENSMQELINKAFDASSETVRADAAAELFEGYEKLVKNYTWSLEQSGLPSDDYVSLTEDMQRWLLYHELSKPVAQGGAGMNAAQIKLLAKHAGEEGYFTGSIDKLDIGRDISKYRAREGTTGVDGVAVGVDEDVQESIDKQQAVKINFKDPVEFGTQMQNMFAQLSSLNPSVRESGMKVLAEVTAKSPPVPEGYEMTRDSQGQPILNFVGIQTGTTQVPIIIDGTETGEYRQEPILSKEAQYQLPAQVLAQYQQGLMLHEQAVGIMTERSAATLGLDIKVAEANIVREEFRMELNLAADKFKLDEKEFESNESLAIGSLTGIFTDADGNEVATLSEREFIAKMTGTIDTGGMTYRADETGKIMAVPISADTIEMQKLRAELSGMFEGQGTISKQQVDAALTGYLENKSPTFAREQWEEARTHARNEARSKAGLIAIEGLVEDVPDPFRPGESAQQLTPQGQALVDAGIATKEQILNNAFFLKSLEARREDLTVKIEEAKLSGLITVPVMQDDGTTVMTTVKTLEQERNDLDAQRLSSALYMEKIQKKMELTQIEGIVRGERRASLGAIGYAELPEDMLNIGDPRLRPTVELRDLEIREGRAGEIEDPSAPDPAAPDKFLSGDRWEGEQQYTQTVSNYTDNIRVNLEEITRVPADDINAATAAVSALRDAINAPLPSTPAGFYWDSSTGSMQQRAGYEGAPISPATQRVIEILGPAMRQRDRAEAVAIKYTEFNTQRQQTEQMHADSTKRLREALNSADIETAEEYAFIKQREEAKRAGYEATPAKYQTLMQLLGEATLLGLARRHGILGKIEADLGITLPHVPMIGSADYIPTPSEWLTMNPEERNLRTSAWAEESGQGVEAFHQLIGQNVPAQIQQTQYATL